MSTPKDTIAYTLAIALRNSELLYPEETFAGRQQIMADAERAIEEVLCDIPMAELLAEIAELRTRRAEQRGAGKVSQ
jgi:hypothetical protein